MKKILALILAMTLLLTACGSDTEEKEETDADDQTTVEQEETNQASETKEAEPEEETRLDEEPKETEPEEAEEKEEEPEEVEMEIDLDGLKDFVSYDASLTGMDLLNSVEHKSFEDYVEDKGIKLTVDMIQISGEMTMEISAEMIAYNDNIWQKMDMMGVTQYSITIVEEGMEKTYSYMEGDTEGSVMVDAYEEGEEDEEGMTPSIFDYYDPDFAPLIEARVEMLGDYETIYIEYGEEGYVTKLWYFPALGSPIKEQTYYDDSMISDMVITNMEILSKIDKDIFELPKEVTFTEE